MSARFVAKLLRRKPMDDAASASPLKRTLGLLTLTALGVGATLGSGVYVLWGVVARNTTGPAVIVSFLISGFASVLSGLCYAEFGARVPRAGSAYVYSYVTVGELLAWTTGWQLLLEYIIGASAVAVSLSGYLDNLFGGAVADFIARLPGGSWSTPGLTQTPDVLAAGLTVLFTIVVAAGVKESTTLNNCLTAVNALVIVFVVCAGLGHARIENLTPFAPFGFSGIFSGAATVFFCFVGFDVIATSAEEALEPARNVPRSIVGSLLICTVAYVAVAAVVCMMVPYSTLDVGAPLAKAFAATGMGWAATVIEIGAVAGLTTSLMTCVFPMPRIVYAIASDGLLPAWLGAVSPRFGTPVWATLLCGGLAATLALIFDIGTLADMMSIGTLVAYSLVCASVLVLRYKDFEEREARGEVTNGGAAAAAAAAAAVVVSDKEERLCAADGGGEGGGGFRYRGMRAFAAASACLGVYVLGLTVASAASVALTNGVGAGGGAALYALYALVAGALTLAAAAVARLARVPSCLPVGVDFVVPFCPWVPLAAIAINVYLLASLAPLTWARFGVWLLLGSGIYFGYGIKHSKVGLANASAEASRQRGDKDGAGADAVDDFDESAPLANGAAR
jgi:amino acid transporter